MPRRTAVNGVKGPTPVMTTDMAATQVPPSTLAAQIVEQHSTGRRKQVENSTFRQLLEEIRLTPSAVENDFESNVKLISVVADAGLDATALKDPFGDIRDTENQIVACLHVIEIAIKRTPSVLSRSIASPDDADFRLSFVLLAKMITLSAHEPLRVTLYRSMHFVSSSMCHGYSKWTTSKAVKLAFHTWVQGWCRCLSSISLYGSLLTFDKPYMTHCSKQHDRRRLASPQTLLFHPLRQLVWTQHALLHRLL